MFETADVVLVKSQLIEMRERSLKMRHEMQHVDAQTRKPRTFPADIAARAKEIL